MRKRFSLALTFLGIALPLAFVGTPAKSELAAFNFQFNAPNFSQPELDPLNQIFTGNSITQATGKLTYDTADAVFVTSNFTLRSNIDSLFDQTPEELVFAPSGNLNQIRAWEVNIGGVRFLLELTNLDETDTLPNRWFGGRIVETGDNVFGLTEAGGGLTPTRVPEPATLALFLASLCGLLFIRKGRAVLPAIRRHGRTAAE